VSSFTLRPLLSAGKKTPYSLNKGMGESQKISGRFGIEKNVLPSSGINGFMGLSSRSLVTELSR